MRLLTPLVLLIAFALSSCEPDVVYTPRPRGYFRIEMPAKNYVKYDSANVPYTFEIPDYARMYRSSAPDAPESWRDLYFGEFKATLYLSYHEITSDSLFAQLVNQSWELTEAHHEMSQAMKDSMILRPDAKVYGTVIELGGNAASLLQFYLTDSTKNFIRGSLYFYAVPNKDSLAPVLNYIKDDVMHLVETIEWRAAPTPEIVTKDPTSAVTPYNSEMSEETKALLEALKRNKNGGGIRVGGNGNGDGKLPAGDGPGGN